MIPSAYAFDPAAVEAERHFIDPSRSAQIAPRGGELQIHFTEPTGSDRCDDKKDINRLRQHSESQQSRSLHSRIGTYTSDFQTDALRVENRFTVSVNKYFFFR